MGGPSSQSGTTRLVGEAGVAGTGRDPIRWEEGLQTLFRVEIGQEVSKKGRTASQTVHSSGEMVPRGPSDHCHGQVARQHATDGLWLCPSKASRSEPAAQPQGPGPLLRATLPLSRTTWCPLCCVHSPGLRLLSGRHQGLPALTTHSDRVLMSGPPLPSSHLTEEC